MRNRIYVLMVLLVIAASAFAAAEGSDAGGGKDGSQSGSGAPALTGTGGITAASDIPVSVESIVPDDKISSCEQILKERFPKVADDRIRKACQVRRQLIAARAAVGAKVSLEVPQWKLQALERVKESNPKAADIIAGLDNDSIQKFMSLDRARQKELIQEGKAKLESGLRSMRLVKLDAALQFRKRVLSNQTLKAAQEKFKEVQLKFLSAKKDLSVEKKAFSDAVRSGNETAAIEHARTYLDSVCDMMINALEKLKEKVNSNDNLAADEAQKMTEDIDARIAEVNAIKEKIAAATTKEELKAAGKDILQLWARTKFRIEYHTAFLARAYSQEILQRSEQLEARLNKVLADMESQGIDTSAIQPKVDNFSEMINGARKDYADALDLFAQAKQGNSTGLVQQAQQKLKEANALLKDAHDLLKEIIKDIKEKKPDADAALSDSGAGTDTIIEDTLEEASPLDPEEPETTDQPDNAPEDGSEPVDTSAPAIDLAEIDKPDCWGDKPAYTPGVDKGFFIWQGTCADFIWVDWSGDTKALWKKWWSVKNSKSADETPTVEEVAGLDLELGELTADEASIAVDASLVDAGATGVLSTAKACIDIVCPKMPQVECRANETKVITNRCCGNYKCVPKPRLLYPVKGRITSNGRIFDVGVRRFDGADVMKFSHNTIWFKARVGPNFDGVYFRTTGDTVTFDLWFDNKRTTKLIYIGKEKKNPAADPFKLSVNPASKAICPDDEVIYDNRCTKSVDNAEVEATASATVLADDGSLASGDLSASSDAGVPLAGEI